MEQGQTLDRTTACLQVFEVIDFFCSLREALKKNILVEKVHNPGGGFGPSPLSMFFFYFSKIYVEIYHIYTP